MSLCSIKYCGARRSSNQPDLTFHRFPKSEVLRQQWFDAIGKDKINTRHKSMYVCSLHFEESHFNRTLDVIRLRDNVVPTLFNVPSSSKDVPVLYKIEIDNIQEKVETAMCKPHADADANLGPACETPSTSKDMCGIGNVKEKLNPILIQPNKDLALACVEDCHHFNRLQKLEKVCTEQRKRIKRMNEKIRRQGKKIATLEELLKT